MYWIGLLFINNRLKTNDYIQIKVEFLKTKANERSKI